MPRIAAALAVLGTVAFCIGFNTVRYPAVWEMFSRPGWPPAAAKPAQPAAVAVKPADGAANRQSQITQRSQPEEELEFCTADGVCHIAAGPQMPKKPELSIASRGVGVSPALSRGGDSSATPRKAETPASSRAGQTPAASRAGETPTPQIVDQAPSLPGAMPSLAVGMSAGQPGDATIAPAFAAVKRPLVPVADDPPKDKKDYLLVDNSGISLTDKNVRPPATDKKVGPPAGTGVRPLPAVEEAGAANRNAIPPLPANGSMPFYPTTGYPSVDLSQLGRP